MLMNSVHSKRNTAFSAALLLCAAGALAAADDLPKGEAILDKYIEVTGGKAAYAKIHSEISTGTMEMAAMGLKGTLTAYSAEPNRRLAEFNLPGIGKMLDGSNGDVAWATNPIQGPRVKDGDEKAQALLEGQFNAEAHWRDLFKSAETVAIEQVDGKDCYKVVITPKVGNPITRWYDKQSNLLVKSKMVTKSPMGELEADQTLSDYRKEGDILQPHKIVAHAAGRELVMTIDKVEYNAEVPKDKFELPDDIKALVKKADK
jgi:Protein of unknown function (DUF620)